LQSSSEKLLTEIGQSRNGYLQNTSILSSVPDNVSSGVNPKISVIIPVLQEEKILEKTLQAYTQELREKYSLEIIISDGGSTDRTIEIAEKYADKIVLHEKKEKQTIAEGRNNGARKAVGNVLVFINGDTIPKNPESFFDFIYNWTENKSSYNDSVALACPVTVVEDEILFRDKVFYTCHNFYVRMLNAIGLGMGRGECQIVKKDSFYRVGGYNELIAAGEDFDLYRRIARIGKVSFAKDTWVYESPRRFRKYGYFRIIMSWTINSLSVWIRGRSVSDEWEPVR
jgi:glycosyltransferase involved in cell wall biosynthesis